MRIIIKFGLFGLVLLALVCLNGCFAPPQGPLEDVCIVERIGSPGKIYRPLIGSGDDWYAVPRARKLLMFGTRRDSYGNPTGLSDDRMWSIFDVTIQCELKNEPDTVFNPPYKKGHFWADGYDNACIWYPTWTGEIEGYSQRPFSPYPEVGYPFNPCWSDFCDEQSPSEKIYIPAQDALITARAEADCVRARITCPDHGEGSYIMDMPGATPQSSNVFEYTFGQPGNYDIIWENGGEPKIYSFLIPAEWFWISGSWSIEVDPQVTCKSEIP